MDLTCLSPSDCNLRGLLSSEEQELANLAAKQAASAATTSPLPLKPAPEGTVKPQGCSAGDESAGSHPEATAGSKGVGLPAQGGAVGAKRRRSTLSPGKEDPATAAAPQATDLSPVAALKRPDGGRVASEAGRSEGGGASSSAAEDHLRAVSQAAEAGNTCPICLDFVDRKTVRLYCLVS